jgi:hypothetical protein
MLARPYSPRRVPTGSYSGLFQLSPKEFERVGGKGISSIPRRMQWQQLLSLRAMRPPSRRSSGGSPNCLNYTWRNATIGSSGPGLVTIAALQTALASGNVIVTTDAAGTDAGDINQGRL